MGREIAIAATLLALLTVPTLAQTPQGAPPQAAATQGTPMRIRGTIEKLNGQDLTVKSREGQGETIALADNVVVAYLVKKNVRDIKPGDYIASTGIKGTDGKLNAIEVRIFPSRCAAPARGNTRGISSPIQ